MIIFPTLLEHALFANKSSPELFLSDPSDTRTSRLAGFLVQSFFHYQVPQLGTLNAEQILEVRDSICWGIGLCIMTVRVCHYVHSGQPLFT
jgi:hypothetical protein